MSAGYSVAVALLMASVLLLWLPPAARRGAPATSRPGARGKNRGGTRRGRRSDLPHLVGLVALGVEAGAPVPEAVLRACAAFEEAEFDDLRAAAESLRHGADPASVWGGLAAPEVAPLARALARSARTGASVVRSLALLADDLAEESRALQEDAARRVGVRAALPLGLCLLPAFLVLGIVPLVAGLASQIVAP